MIAIIKYQAGNISSVQNALNRLGVESKVTNDPQEILSATKVILPGVGQASTAMKSLRENDLDILLKQLKQPVLGICLGMQLMCKSSEEGNTTCLDIFDAEIKLFPPKEIVPHMGWNNVQILQRQLYEGISQSENFYFVHSYYASVTDDTSAICDYILPFSASLQKHNFYATQFHPEKSADAGSKILQNFLNV